MLLGSGNGGLKGHKLDDLSRNADLFEYIFTQAPIQYQIDAFGEGKDCKTLDEFEALYLTRFVEKDKAYEADAKTKAAISARERRFQDAFGIESESESD
ncbi:unnamed protein product [Phytophthora fragariaefolia]|uniref:Unnamed protein product n=1 Tax=Phytophthora fragariaefolia TaxID=1490495 RepID=A0A9W7D293_9STRA|nr:unnamed protein product [Phytophthora fragariaefolia]